MKIIQKFHPIFRFELPRFLTVGMAATIVHFTVAQILSLLATPPILCNSFAFLIALSVSFLGHYYWTFKSDAPRLQSFIKLFLIGLFSLAVSNAFLWLSEKLAIFPTPINLALSVPFIPLINYILAKYWAFQPPSQSSAQKELS